MKHAKTKQSHAGQVRTTVEGLLAHHAAAGGKGKDAYWDERLYHPMADAKFLMALTALRQTDLLSISKYQHLAEETARRLKMSSVQARIGRAWGLGFTWRQLPPDEPFLITTALVAEALGMSRSALSDSPLVEIEETYREAVHTIASWCGRWVARDSLTGQMLPIYSPGISEPVLNTAAMACKVLVRYGADAGVSPAQITKARVDLQCIANSRIKSLGWKYCHNSPIVDLIHQSYLLSAMQQIVEASVLEEWVHECLSVFSANETFQDRCRIVGKEYPGIGTEVVTIRKFENYYVEFPIGAARLWSVGELLAVVCAIASASTHRTAWKKCANRLSGWIMQRLISGHLDSCYPRQTMHAAWGLASYLQLLRTCKGGRVG